MYMRGSRNREAQHCEQTRQSQAFLPECCELFLPHKCYCNSIANILSTSSCSDSVCSERHPQTQTMMDRIVVAGGFETLLSGNIVLVLQKLDIVQHLIDQLLFGPSIIGANAKLGVNEDKTIAVDNLFERRVLFMVRMRPF